MHYFYLSFHRVFFIWKIFEIRKKLKYSEHLFASNQDSVDEYFTQFSLFLVYMYVYTILFLNHLQVSYKHYDTLPLNTLI